MNLESHEELALKWLPHDKKEKFLKSRENFWNEYRIGIIALLLKTSEINPDVKKHEDATKLRHIFMSFITREFKNKSDYELKKFAEHINGIYKYTGGRSDNLNKGVSLGQKTKLFLKRGNYLILNLKIKFLEETLELNKVYLKKVKNLQKYIKKCTLIIDEIKSDRNCDKNRNKLLLQHKINYCINLKFKNETYVYLFENYLTKLLNFQIKYLNFYQKPFEFSTKLFDEHFIQNGIISNVSDIYYKLGNLYESYNQFFPALESYLNAWKLDKNYYPAILNVLKILEKDSSLISEFKEIKDFFNEVEGPTYKKNSQILYAYSKIYWKVDGKVKAINTLKSAKKISPRNLKIRNKLIKFYRSLNRFQDAIKELESVIKIKWRRKLKNLTNDYYKLAQLYYYNKNYNLAIENCALALQKCKNEYFKGYIHYLMGMTYKALGNAAESKKHLDTSIKNFEKEIEDPDKEIRGLRKLYRVCVEIGEPDKGEKYYLKKYRMEKNYCYLCECARVIYKNGKDLNSVHKSIKYYEKTLKVASKTKLTKTKNEACIAYINNFLGIVYERKNINKAIDYYEKAVNWEHPEIVNWEHPEKTKILKKIEYLRYKDISVVDSHKDSHKIS